MSDSARVGPRSGRHGMRCRPGPRDSNRIGQCSEPLQRISREGARKVSRLGAVCVVEEVRHRRIKDDEVEPNGHIKFEQICDRDLRQAPEQKQTSSHKSGLLIREEFYEPHKF
jgi:hypothetical protein